MSSYAMSLCAYVNSPGKNVIVIVTVGNLGQAGAGTLKGRPLSTHTDFLLDGPKHLESKKGSSLTLDYFLILRVKLSEEK